MIEHAEDTTQQRQERRHRPTLARTLCNRWVDVVRLAVRDDAVTCETCRKRQAVR